MEGMSGKNSAVIGAGPAGLTAAYQLAKNGVGVSVFEKDAVVGGLAKTVIRDGFRFDLGGHRWYTEDERLNDFFKKACGKHLLEVPRTTRIYFKGEFFSLPIRVGEILSKLGPFVAFRALANFASAKLSGSQTSPFSENLRQAYVKQFGRTLFELFFERYNEKLWGMSCDELAGDWISIRAKGLSLATTLKGLVSKDESIEAIDTFLYPRRGIGQFSQLLAEGVRNHGGEVFLSSGVVGIERNNGGYSIILGGGEECNFDTLVSTVPITDLVKMLGGPVPKLSFRDLVIVTLFFDQSQITPDSWVYTQDPIVGFVRFHEPKNWSSDMCPEGKTSIVLEYPCWEDDGVWSSTDEELIRRGTVEFCDKLGLADKEKVSDGAAVRVKKAYPIYKMGYKQELEDTQDFLNSFESLYYIGRSGAFVYESMAHPVRSGLEVAETILER